MSVSIPGQLKAQAPPVPSTFQDLYTELDNYLVNFNATLGTPPKYPYLLCGNLLAANGNAGPQLLNAGPNMPMQINALKAMGAQAIAIEIGFPMLYEPFLTSQGETYAAWASYYQSVAAAVRAAGLKLVIENDTLLVNDVQAGWDAAPFYATLNWTQYMQARAQTALNIAQLMQPDYLMVLAEPQTEYDNSGQANTNTPSGSGQLLSQIISTVKASVPALPLGAGVGTAQINALSFIQEYVTLPVDFIDMHIYPINRNYLPIAQQIAQTAAAAGKPVSMTECGLWKIRDTEVNVLSIDQVRARDPFSFWQPLDAYFLQTMETLANSTQMIFMNPFGTDYWFAYQTYDDSTMNMDPATILGLEGSLAAASLNQAAFTSTALNYYNSVVTPADTTPPTAPTTLTAGSGNPNTALVKWNASTDNVGVAGYYVWRTDSSGNSQIVNTTAGTSFQDSGLTEAATYTYTAQAFDLGGNVSTQSAPVSVQTTNATPPTTPGNLTAQAVSCYKVQLSWTASTDKTGVTQYNVFYGVAPSAMSQIGTTGSSTTAFGNSTLSPGQTYYFAVQAQDQYKNVSAMSSIVTVTTPTLPTTPSGVSAVPNTATKITVTWSPSTGGLPIAHYLVYRGTSASNLNNVATVTKASYTDTSVSASTTYYYSIQSADTGTPPTQSGLSAPVSATTYGYPSVPANVAAAPSSATKVVVTWSASASGGLPIANYRVYKGSSPSSMTQLAITPNTSYTDSTDAPSTTYYYAVQAADTGLPADLSAISPAVAVTTYGLPGAPANLTANVVSASKIGLSWSAATSGGLPIANYHVYEGTSPTSLTQVTITTNTSYTATSLHPGTTYYFAVQSTDTGKDNSALSNSVSATTLNLPTTPTNVTATGISSTQITVSWSASTGSLPIAHYNVLRGSTPTSLSALGTTTKTTYNDKTVNPGTTYYYQIQAADTAGDLSAGSTPVAGTSLP
ncbi:MAG TPA: fibronectin type III domain-containing protein [Bryobacteraceae bacterium]|nr:fibronectin type III domain-containing protein [Bryobacteraceae bacterium]